MVSAKLYVCFHFLSNRENLCATFPWVRARIPGQMVARTRGMSIMAYDTGQEHIKVSVIV